VRCEGFTKKGGAAGELSSWFGAVGQGASVARCQDKSRRVTIRFGSVEETIVSMAGGRRHIQWLHIYYVHIANDDSGGVDYCRCIVG